MPNMFNTYPKAELEKIYHIPRTHLEYKEKQIKDRRYRKKEDETNKLLGFDDYNAQDNLW